MEYRVLGRLEVFDASGQTVSHGNAEIRTRGLFSRMLRQAGKSRNGELGQVLAVAALTSATSAQAGKTRCSEGGVRSRSSRRIVVELAWRG
jgi:hypothetical protein